jgi:hypothetical protein
MEPQGIDPELVEQLSLHDRELEKVQALHLNLCDIIVSCDDHSGREWIKPDGSNF